MRFLLLLSFTLSTIMGCGSGQLPLGYVSGQVTYQGQPVSGGIIHFVPDAGPAASGVLDESGRYELTTYHSGDGAVVGHHQVFFSPPSDDSHLSEYTDADYAAGKIPPEPTNLYPLPPKYFQQQQSGLQADVTAGSQPLDFDLE